MDESARTDRLAALFRETGSAHHQAFLATDGEDPEWPIWYAGYLRPRIGALVEPDLTESEIVYHVLHAEQLRADEDPAAPWPEYYATYFEGLGG